MIRRKKTSRSLARTSARWIGQLSLAATLLFGAAGCQSGGEEAPQRKGGAAQEKPAAHVEHAPSPAGPGADEQRGGGQANAGTLAPEQGGGESVAEVDSENNARPEPSVEEAPAKPSESMARPKLKPARDARPEPVARERKEFAKKDMKRVRRPSRPAPASPVMAPPPPPRPDSPVTAEGSNTEEYKDHGINPWTTAVDDRLSTFAIDVDTASYTIARRKIESGVLPPSASIRAEEFVNYFKYRYAGPEASADTRPFSVHVEGSPSPFSPTSHFVRVGVQGKELTAAERKPANLTFLIDTSGSMSAGDKLPLAKRSLHLLVDQLQDGDMVSLVTYAGGTRVVLPPTPLSERGTLHAAIEDLRSGGGTAMGSGMLLAYAQANAAKTEGSVNRVIVISDGDANIGRTSQDEILKTIDTFVKDNITMTVIGVGMGNYKDHRMEQLANRGNGNYFYIDGFSEAKRVFQQQLGGTLQVIAKDVKIQVDFNPEVVKRYRLVGYENRDIADVDFRNDKVDAGEIGAGHSVTAIYEVELHAGVQADLGTVRLRHKAPEGDVASENAYALPLSALTGGTDDASDDFRTALAAAAFAEHLRKSPHAATWELDAIARLAESAAGKDPDRHALVAMIQRVKQLEGAPQAHGE